MSETLPDNKTIVCLLGDLQIDQEKVSVGVVSAEETIVQLDKPASLGNALTVGSWLNDSWGTKVDALLVKKPVNGKVGSQSGIKKEDIVKHLTEDLKYPDQVVNILADLFLARIVITDLYIRLWKDKADGKEVSKKAFKFGIAVDFSASNGLTLFGDIKLTSLKLGILNAPPDYDFAAKTLVLPPLRLLDYDKAKKESEE